jgi:REP element-mobilizing transposase RayT
LETDAAAQEARRAGLILEPSDFIRWRIPMAGRIGRQWRHRLETGAAAREARKAGLMHGAVEFHSMAGEKRKISMKRAGAFYQLVYHFSWSTKNRLPLILPEVEIRLYPYIGYKCKELGYRLHAVNGVEDHIHVLVSLTPSQLVADVAKNLKGASSHYINKESGLGATLYW